MITTVTKKNTVTIPAEIRRRYGVKPGYRLEWRAGEAADEVRVRFIPERGGWRGDCWARDVVFHRNGMLSPNSSPSERWKVKELDQ